MRVVLIIGADCVPLETGKRDFERTLTEAGKEQATGAAEFLNINGVQLEYILASPFNRAQETGKCLAEKLKNDCIVETVQTLMPGLDVDDLIKTISTRISGLSCQWIGVVIHQTDADYILQSLLNGGEIDYRIPVCPGLIIGMDIVNPKTKNIDLLFLKYPAKQ